MKQKLFIYPFVVALACLMALLAPSADSSSSSSSSIASAAPLAQTPQLAAQDVGAILRGQVIPAQGKLIVELLSMSGQLLEQTRTDSEGWYSFPPLASGDYQLRVFDQNQQELVLARGARFSVLPADSFIEHELSLALSDTGEVMRVPEAAAPKALQEAGGDGYITGIVTAADTGLPLQSVSVRAYNDYTSRSGYTDNSGVYSITVDADTYHVEFTPSNSSEYAPEWYDNQPHRATANPILVTSGAIVSDINAVLEVGGQIIGQVTAADDGTPLQNVGIRAYDSLSSTDYVAYTSSDELGVYDLNGLITGTYYLKFEAPYNSVYLDEYYDDQATLATATPISVTLGDTVVGINAALTTGGTITGTVTAAEDGIALPNVSVRVYDSITSTTHIASGSTDLFGTYEIVGLPAGSYYLSFEAPYNSIYLDEYYNNQATLALADPISVQLGETVSDIDAALETGGTITGTVTAAEDGTPLQSVSVRVYTDTTSTEYIASGNTDQNGLYQVLGLPAGSYYLKFDAPYNSIYLDEYYDNHFTLAEADSIDVALNTVVQIDAALETGGTINGVVTAVVGGTPIESVRVYAYDSPTSTDHLGYHYTSATGVYTITGLYSGTYYLCFEAPNSSNYLDECHQNQMSQATASPVSVTLNQVISIDAALETGGTLTGIVSAEADGTPLENVRVYVYDSLSSTTHIAYDYTDASGVYTITALYSDNYYLYFEARCRVNYLDEYYLNQPSLTKAAPVNVPLDTIVSVDAALATGGIIIGQVTAADTGLPLEDVRVSIASYNSTIGCNNSGCSYSADTDASGFYTITRLATGSYNLSFEPQSSDSAYLATTHQSVEVSTGSVINEDAALERGGQIMGQVTASDNGAPLASVGVLLYTYDEQNQDFDYQGYSFTDENGVYTTGALETDNYRLYFSSASGGASATYLPQYYNNQATLESANDVSVTVGEITSDIDVVLTRGGQITGRITAEDDGAPLEDVYVYVYTSTTSIRSVAFGSTDENGVYTTTGVATGDYYLLFSPRRWGTAAADYIAEYYNKQSTLANATSVAVTTSSMTANIDAQLTRGGTITGQVTAEETGEPLEGIKVVAYDSNGHEVGVDYTDYNGIYVISGLPPGIYYVLFFQYTYHWGCSGTIVIQYSGTYYKQKPDFQTADPVFLMDVRGAESVVNINAVLARGTYQPPLPNSNAPILTMPPNMTVEASSPSGAVVTFAVTATDESDPNPTIVCAPASGSTFPLGITTVDCTATDNENNSSSNSFTITVLDTTPPTLNMPADMSIFTTTPAGTVVTFSITLTDTVDANPTLECSPSSGSLFPLGTTTVECTATDASGNQASQSFTITVIEATYQLHLPLVRRE